MANYPATTVKVVSVEPQDEAKVRITMEMIVDVHRLADVGSDMLRAAMVQVKAEQRTKKKK
jgi:ribosomal protein L21